MIDVSQNNDDQLEQDSEMGVGTLGIWEGKLGENEVGMIVDDEVLQMFQKKEAPLQWMTSLMNLLQ